MKKSNSQEHMTFQISTKKANVEQVVGDRFVENEHICMLGVEYVAK